MHAKLKRRINKLFGINAWRKLALEDRIALGKLGAHKVWLEYKDKLKMQQMIDDGKLLIQQEMKRLEIAIVERGNELLIGVDMAAEGLDKTAITEGVVNEHN